VPTSPSGHLRLASEYNTELAAQPPAKVRSSLFHFHVGLWPILLKKSREPNEAELASRGCEPF
jgi:hypothetical protein